MFKIIYKRVLFHKQYSQYNNNNVYSNAAITANSSGCANIGRRILEQGGSVADAAIATLFCGGVRNPERMGLGGGFVMIIYHKELHRVEVLIARERAPLAATRDMFKQQGNNERLSIFGGLAVGVPGSLMGYWELHRRYGRLPWSTLLEPSIALCKTGVKVEPFTNYGLQQIEHILTSHSLKQILVDPFSGRVKSEKHTILRHKLAETLESIAQFGPNVLYNGHLTAGFVHDVQNAGGIITVEDMNRYSVKWLEPVSITVLDEVTVYSPPPPVCGPVLLLTLNSLIGHLLKTDHVHIFWHKLIEIWKYAYGYRSRLGDPDFVPGTTQIIEEMLSGDTAHKIRSTYNNSRTINDPKHYGGEFNLSTDGGTAHFNFLAPNGDAIAHTETINTLFGAMIRSVSTGIILNNTMDDFSIPDVANVFGLPPSIANQIQPSKMPLSSMTPTIIIDRRTGDVQMLIGAAGGTKIISAISLTIAKYLMQGVDLVEAVCEPRLHHQLMPMHIEFENGFPEDILNQLRDLGHTVKPMSKYATLSVIARKDGKLHAKCDWRRHGATDGF